MGPQGGLSRSVAISLPRCSAGPARQPRADSSASAPAQFTAMWALPRQSSSSRESRIVEAPNPPAGSSAAARALLTIRALGDKSRSLGSCRETLDPTPPSLRRHRSRRKKERFGPCRRHCHAPTPPLRGLHVAWATHLGSWVATVEDCDGRSKEVRLISRRSFFSAADQVLSWTATLARRLGVRSRA
jgi:hypothetical protein